MQLEDLVEAVSPSEPAAWFRSSGRQFRNAVAHGRWKGTTEVRTIDEENEFLVAIAVATVRGLLRFIVDQPEPTSNPTGEFVDDLTAGLG